MLKFFRKIRKRLLEKKQLKTYLLYGLGEIFLVVIGILIAIGINNYYNFNQNRIAERQILNRLKSDLHHDVDLMKQKISSFKFQKNSIVKTIEALYDSNMDLLIKANSFNNLIDQYSSPKIEFRVTTYKEIENTNRLDLITNVDLREAIINFYNEAETFNIYSGDRNEWLRFIHKTLDVNTQIIKFSDILSEFLTSSVHLNLENIAFLNDPSSEKFQLVENTIFAEAYHAKESIIAIEGMQKKTEELIRQIEIEIKQRWNR